jgi:cold shock CspA family protein
VRGAVHRIGSAGFLLADGGASIFVGAPATDLSNLEEGRRVEVRAELERLSRFRANSIPEALAGTPETAANAAEGVDFDQVPTAAGEPFLVLRTVTPLP